MPLLVINGLALTHWQHVHRLLRQLIPVRDPYVRQLQLVSTFLSVRHHLDISTLPGSSSAGQQPWNLTIADIDETAHPILSQIEREEQEATLARKQGCISGKQYGEILIDCLARIRAEDKKQTLGIQRAMRGEDSWEQIQRDSGRTDAAMHKLSTKTERTIRVQLESHRRIQARKFHQTITRGL
ncbi:hypothetical protein DENSPDRAFT_842148 [Dentipellis sp. KUC8613]|nr:hypothetical protein DENSPDRAFT_842148 [Dentipellis sp. KUC8613]